LLDHLAFKKKTFARPPCIYLLGHFALFLLDDLAFFCRPKLDAALRRSTVNSQELNMKRNSRKLQSLHTKHATTSQRGTYVYVVYRETKAGVLTLVQREPKEANKDLN
jgi:hypothetical protein